MSKSQFKILCLFLGGILAALVGHTNNAEALLKYAWDEVWGMGTIR